MTKSNPEKSNPEKSNPKKQPSNAVAELNKLSNMRGIISGGFLIVFGFIVVFLLWGGLVPISTAAVAQGTVGVEGHKKLIQHLGGGIIESIKVRDGDLVEAGQILVELNGVDENSKYDDLNGQIIQEGTALARWMAEYNDVPDIELPEWLRNNSRPDQVQKAYSVQKEILRARRTVLEGSLANLSQKSKQTEEEEAAAKSKLKSLGRKSSLIQAELAEYKRLEQKGLVTRNQLFDLQRQRADLRLDIEEARSSIALAITRRAQIESEIADLENASRMESAEQSTLVRNELQTLRQQIAIAGNAVDRLSIRSPISGYVINSVVNTRGGVITPGQTIMEVMPMNERLLIETKIEQKDRDSIRVGQKAEVRFSAFKRRSALPVEGVVKLISADSTPDEINKTAYYTTTVELLQNPNEVLGGSDVYPGMQADVLIVTGKQTFLQYLTDPFSRSFNRALKEE